MPKLSNIALYIRPCSNEKKSKPNKSRHIQYDIIGTNFAFGFNQKLIAKT